MTHEMCDSDDGRRTDWRLTMSDSNSADNSTAVCGPCLVEWVRGISVHALREAWAVEPV